MCPANYPSNRKVLVIYFITRVAQLVMNWKSGTNKQTEKFSLFQIITIIILYRSQLFRYTLGSCNKDGPQQKN